MSVTDKLVTFAVSNGRVGDHHGGRDLIGLDPWLLERNVSVK